MGVRINELGVLHRKRIMGLITTMKSQLFRGNIDVRKSHIHRYGVFANKNFNPGELIEECYALSINDDESRGLINYLFQGGYQCNVLPLGYGCIYNHSNNPNAAHRYYPDLFILTIHAKKFIKKGEEIFISYGDDWFTSRGIKRRERNFLLNLKPSKFSLFFLRFLIVFVAVAAFILLSHVKINRDLLTKTIQTKLMTIQQY